MARDLVRFLGLCPFCRLVAAPKLLRPRLAYVVTRYASSGFLTKETRGAPTCPGSPSEGLPRSATPVGSAALALARRGLLPAAALTASALATFLAVGSYP